jgi:hypothetical protein
MLRHTEHATYFQLFSRTNPKSSPQGSCRDHRTGPVGTLHRPNASQVATGSLQGPPRGLCSKNGYRQAFANRANGGHKLRGRGGRLGASEIIKRVAATILSHAAGNLRLRRYLALRERSLMRSDHRGSAHRRAELRVIASVLCL